METNKEIVELEDVLENLSMQLRCCRNVYEEISGDLLDDSKPN